METKKSIEEALSENGERQRACRQKIHFFEECIKDEKRGMALLCEVECILLERQARMEATC